MRRGFTLPEIMVTVLLLGVVAAAGTRLFHQMLIASGQERTVHVVTQSRSSLVQHLRQDLWRAQRVSVGDELVVDGREGQIRYVFADGRTTRRSAVEPEMAWPVEAKVQARPGGVNVILPDGRTIAMVSLDLQARGEQ